MAGSSLTYRILGDPSSAVRAMQKTRNEVEKSTKGMRSSFASLGKVAAGLGVASFVKESIEGWEDHQRVMRQTAAVIRSTAGAAGLNRKQFESLSDAIEKQTGLDGDLVLNAENVLATFTNVRNGVGKNNDVFSQATKTIGDMSAALGSDMKGSAIQVGKALNDPIRGITALSKVGVTFTQQQRKQITQMVKSGHTMAAQKVILRELNKEFGGSAAAQETSSQKMQVAMHELQDAVGQALAPAMEKFATILTDDVIPAGTRTVNFLKEHATEAKIVAGAVGGIWVAYRGYRIVGNVIDSMSRANAQYRRFVGQVATANGQATRSARGLTSAVGGAAVGAAFGALTRNASDSQKAVGALASTASGAAIGFATGGPWGAAIGGATGLVSDLATQFWGARDATKAEAQALDDQKRAALELATTLANTKFRKQAAAIKDAAIGGLSGAFEKGNQYDISPATITKAALGSYPALQQATNQILKANGDLGKSWNEVSDRSKKAIRSMNVDIFDATEKARRAEVDYENASVAAGHLGFAHVKLTREVKRFGTTLDTTTAFGQRNTFVIKQQASDIANWGQKQIAAGKSASWVSARMRAQVSAFVDGAKVAGFNTTKLRELIAEYSLVPVKVGTKLVLVDEASARLQRIANAMAAIHDKTVTVTTLKNGVGIGGHAAGTSSAPAGWAWVGERGPELMRFKGGEQVLSHPQSMQVAGAGGYANGTVALGDGRPVVNVRVLLSHEQIREIARVEIDGAADHTSTIGRMRR